jgi:hypothetical protein
MDAYHLIDDLINKEWQEIWDKEKTGRLYHQLHPKIQQTTRQPNSNRRNEVIIARLQLGKCCLNAYLHTMGKGDGMCTTCRQPETIEHYLLQCDNNVAKEIRQQCKTLNLPETLDTVLTDQRTIQTILRLNRRKL